MATTPTITKRTMRHDILGPSKILFARAGTIVDTNTVSASFHPDPETAEEAWADMGEPGNFQPTLNGQDITVKKCLRDGTWTDYKEDIISDMTLSFAGTQMTPEAYELMFGLKGRIDDSKPQQLAARGSLSIQGWLLVEVKRTQDGTDVIQQLIAWGRLKIKTAPNMQMDFAKPEFDFIVELGNPMSTLTPANIQTLATTPA